MVQLLGDKPLKISGFKNLKLLFKKFQTLAFKKSTSDHKYLEINKLLYSLIDKAPQESFLLPAVNEYINLVNESELLPGTYDFSLFEYWLIHLSDLTIEQQYAIRGKITGRTIPREEYQCYFPVGMDKKQDGSHFVIAHLSPDVDTTIASFWGWVDAFSAMVSSGQHFWCVPGGPPDSPSMILFEQYFGKKSIQNYAKFTKSIRVLSTDVLTKESMVIKSEKTLVDSVEHGYHDKAVILVDEQGFYVGDFHSQDVEQVRQVIVIIKACLNWFQNNFQMQLISLFGKKSLHIKEFERFYINIFESSIKTLQLALEFSPLQNELLEKYFVIVLNLQKGLSVTMAELADAYSKNSICLFRDFKNQFETYAYNHLFDKSGHLIEDRPKIFYFINTIFKELHDAIMEIKTYIERLDIIMAIKTKVLKLENTYVSFKDDVDYIKQKIGKQPYLTVVKPEMNGKLFPMGVIWADDVRKPSLGTVTFRDFSNFQEVQMPSYLNVVSLIDHHKTSISTTTTPNAIIGDVQSCNILIAEQAIMLNEKFSTAGMSLSSIQEQIDSLNKKKASKESSRLLQRLHQRRSAILNSESHHYHIDPNREFLEYLFYIHATLDDTDLLTKVSYRDVVCITKLLNLMKSIQLKKEVEIINLDGLPKDSRFPKAAANRILQNEEMFSIYEKVYALKEKGIENLLKLKSDSDLTKLFSDTKEQNGCCRIGQTKLFRNNIPQFLKVVSKLRSFWYANSAHLNETSPIIDLFIQMISTITSADEVYQGKTVSYAHKDEFWFWASPNGPGLDHLNNFLLGFKNAPELQNNPLELELFGLNHKDLRRIFEENFSNIPVNIAKNSDKGIPIAVLRFRAGLLNSRKSMVSPYLPQLNT